MSTSLHVVLLFQIILNFSVSANVLTPEVFQQNNDIESFDALEKAERISKKACDGFRLPDHLRYKRIIGGSPTEENEFPHFALLGFKNEKGIDFQCGGTVISAEFVLTAGHCAQECLGKICKIRLGANSMNATEDVMTDFDVKKVIVHPNHTINFSQYNDIGLLELSKPVEFSSRIRPACLPQQRSYLEVPLKVAGFGRTSIINHTIRSEKLLKATLFKVPLDDCRRKYAELLKGERKFFFGFPDGIVESQLCAKSRGKHADTCRGDSGGGLYLKSDQFDTVVGITSFGIGCNSSFPGFYTRVHEYLDWIEDIVWAETQ